MADSPAPLAGLLRWLGVEVVHVSHRERWVSALGAMVAIATTYLISRIFLDVQSSLLLLASMGAGAVLLFAVPHGALSQPWPAIGGHLVSALIGVTVQQQFAQVEVAAPLAVSLAILVMHDLRCLHPPGGATALITVIGGPDVHALGYAFVCVPVMLNAVVMVLVALAFNNLFSWRRYPASLSVTAPDVVGDLQPEDIRCALSELDLTVDVSEQELLTIYRRAREKQVQAGSRGCV